MEGTVPVLHRLTWAENQSTGPRSTSRGIISRTYAVDDIASDLYTRVTTARHEFTDRRMTSQGPRPRPEERRRSGAAMLAYRSSCTDRVSQDVLPLRPLDPTASDGEAALRCPSAMPATRRAAYRWREAARHQGFSRCPSSPNDEICSMVCSSCLQVGRRWGLG